MTTKRNVRKDFNRNKIYRVDVTGCTEDVKKEVQQAFFDLGILWELLGSEYSFLLADQYTNATSCGCVGRYLTWGESGGTCNVSAKEFLELVYEPENQGHVHAELMAQYAEDAKTHYEPWKVWQFRIPDGTWLDCTHTLGWDPSCEFRRKPKTKLVHGVEIPDLHIKKEPSVGTTLYCADPLKPQLFSEGVWPREPFEEWYKRALRLELLYEGTPEGKQAAILHAKAWLGIA